eukprot:6361704-Amphidinium_carterae.1
MRLKSWLAWFTECSTAGCTQKMWPTRLMLVLVRLTDCAPQLRGAHERLGGPFYVGLLSHTCPPVWVCGAVPPPDLEVVNSWTLNSGEDLLKSVVLQGACGNSRRAQRVMPNGNGLFLANHHNADVEKLMGIALKKCPIARSTLRRIETISNLI